MNNEDMKALDSVLKTASTKSSDWSSILVWRKKIDSLITSRAPDVVIHKAMGMSEDANKWERRLFIQALKFYKKRGGGVLGVLYDTVPVAMFILLPIFAFILKLFFFKRGRYSHHLVFGFYFFSFLFTVFSLILLVNKIIDIPDWIDTLLVFSTFIYLFLAVKKFYGQGYIMSFIKSNLVVFVYSFFVLLISICLVFMTAYWFY